ncbi:MAG TPA: hypothetical protein VLL76_02175, partial [Candidatus Omnitrophota bacterium]|nr:hypothetical protein [Candidatus Omnitrophota bacterium]
MIKRRRRKGFLEDFRLSETYLVKPDRKLGRPGILEGEDGQGNSVLIKIWPVVAKGDDEDLREI